MGLRKIIKERPEIANLVFEIYSLLLDLGIERVFRREDKPLLTKKQALIRKKIGELNKLTGQRFSSRSWREEIWDYANWLLARGLKIKRLRAPFVLCSPFSEKE